MSLQQSSSNEFSSTQNPTCSNCGTSGHGFRHCTEPVSSYGVLVFRWIGKTEEWSPTNEFCSDTRSPTGLIQTQPEVLMIQRKDSLGFMDILRGKYKINDPDYIRKQLMMTLISFGKIYGDLMRNLVSDMLTIDIHQNKN